MIEERTVYLSDHNGVVLLLKSFDGLHHDGKTLAEMFDAAADGTLELPATWGPLKVRSEREPKFGYRSFIVTGHMGHCPDCGNDYSGPLDCNCFGQRQNFVPRNRRNSRA